MSKVDEAIEWSRKKPLTKEELSGFGFGKARCTAPETKPYIKISSPSKEDGPKGFSIEAGVKGTF